MSCGGHYIVSVMITTYTAMRRGVALLVAGRLGDLGRKRVTERGSIACIEVIATAAIIINVALIRAGRGVQLLCKSVSYGRDEIGGVFVITVQTIMNCAPLLFVSGLNDYLGHIFVFAIIGACG